jgi:3-oxochol-4-en-24-oyl-CoA dehydrogenase
VFMERLTRLRLDVWDLASLYERFADQVRRGEPLGNDVSILKLVGSETYQRLSELALEALGPAGGLEGEIPLGGEPDNVMSLFMNARPSTIYGGSNEVQRNVLAKQVLELPA